MRRMFFFVVLVAAWSALDYLTLVSVREGAMTPWEGALLETVLGVCGACWFAGKMDRSATS